MLDFLIFLGGLVVLTMVVGLCKFIAETYAELKEKEHYDLELKKKQDALALEAQRKKTEQELELRKQAGLDPIYQEQMRKNQQYKVIIASLIAFIVLTLCYLLVPKSDSIPETEYISSSTEDDITASSQEESSLGQNNQNLPERFIPAVGNENKIASTPSTTQPTVELREVVETAVENPFEGNTSNTNTRTSDQISVYEAGSYIGENTTVCGEVNQISQTSKATYMNFGGEYPKHKFSAVMWSNTTMPASEGSNICITGLIESYKGMPQIVISSIENQVSSY